MNYEKEYKNSIERAREQIAACGDDEGRKKMIYKIFPELTETDDEKTRKGLIAFFQRFPYENLENVGLSAKDAISWLEKLGGRKATDNAEPKFKIGDWVVYDRNDHSREIMQIYGIRDGRYYFDGNAHFSWSIKECDEKSHLWTIQDEKDGDALAAHECYVIFKEIDGLNIRCHCTYHYMGFNPSLYVDTLQNKTAFHPATEEERDVLFQKMKEAGYEWDAEKKELKKIEQNPTWSEQNPYPETLDRAIELYYYSYGNGKGGFDNLSFEKFKGIIKTFVEDYGIESAWSEEDELNLEFWLDNNKSIDADKRNWLRSIKDRVHPQPKQEWSEEDWKHYHKLEYILDADEHYSKTEKSSGYQKDVHETLNWFRSLKGRRFPQPHWKPSEYDISLLEEMARNIRNNVSPFCSEVSSLEDLIENLKSI